MDRIWGYVGGICLLVLAGCVPVQHWAKGETGKESTASVKPEVKAPEVETSTPAQKTPEATPPQTAPQPPSPPEPTGYRIAGDDPLVTERIRLYQQKKSEWETAGKRLAGLGANDALPESWNECQQDIDLALAGYQRLQAGTERELNPWEAVGRDMHYFAKECNQVLATAQTKVSSPQDLSANQVPDSAIAQIRQPFEAGQYQEVVNACDALAHGKDVSLLDSRELKILYSRALVKLGRFQEAARILTKLPEDASQTIDLAPLETKMLIGDVLLAVGQVEEARQAYEGLAKTIAPLVSQQEWASAHVRAFGEQIPTEDLKAYRELLQAYLRFDGQQVPQALIDGVSRLQGRSNATFEELARMLLAKATAQSQAWAQRQLAGIKALVAANNLSRARELLQQLIAAAPADMKSAITQLESEIAQAELVAKESPKPIEEVRPASPWEEALHLFEQQKYDEAISGFQQFLDSERGAEAKAKVAAASELAAAAMRRQAAALYAKAKKSSDPEAKQQSLLSSRTLLLELIEKYPNSSVVDKARQNLKVLEVDLGQAATTAPLAPTSVIPQEMNPSE